MAGSPAAEPPERTELALVVETTHLTPTIDADADDDEALVWRWKHRVALRHYIEDLVARGCPPHLALEIARPVR
jgi:hypothetical protein